MRMFERFVSLMALGMMFLLAPGVGAQAQNNIVNAPIDLIFDIDWSTFYSVEESQRDTQTLVFENKLYRPTDHLTIVLETLLARHPEVRLHFFSGGSAERNNFLLKNQILSNGQSLYDVATHVFSNHHLTEVARDESLNFPQRYKKVVASCYNLAPYNAIRSLVFNLPLAHPLNSLLLKI